jgi:hypothetical protein
MEVIRLKPFVDSAPGHHLKLKKPLRSRWGFCFCVLVTGDLVLGTLFTGNVLLYGQNP